MGLVWRHDADRFDTDDLGHRTLVFVQMLLVAGLAATVGGVFEGQSTGFALSFVAVRTVLVYLYVRVYTHVEAARPLAVRLGATHAATTALWFASLFVPEPLRFVL